jgi:hypothetical protein
MRGSTTVARACKTPNQDLVIHCYQVDCSAGADHCHRSASFVVCPCSNLWIIFSFCGCLGGWSTASASFFLHTWVLSALLACHTCPFYQMFTSRLGNARALGQPTPWAAEQIHWLSLCAHFCPPWQCVSRYLKLAWEGIPPISCILDWTAPASAV